MNRLLTAAACALALLIPAAALADAFPADSSITIGTLDNGLRYYVKRNPHPQDRVELRLVVKAGSVLEEDDQQGLAHFLEHMAFNGTEHFASNDMVAYLESIGAQFGADLNAYTSFDETVYMLEIPTDKEGLLEQGVLILRDWAGAITLDPAEFEKERGVVLEEWRLGQGATQRLSKKTWPVVLKDSRYAERLPIGDPEVIQNADISAIRRFYETWYRPDLMAVVAVGDIEPGAMTRLIRESFGDLRAKSAPVDRPVYTVPHHQETLAVVATDPEQSYTAVSVIFKHDRTDPEKVETYRKDIVDGLFSIMLNQRLGEIAQQPDAPFMFGASSPSSFTQGTDMFMAIAGVRENEVNRGLAALYTEIARVRAHGFTEGELLRAKSEVLSQMESAFRERDKTESRSLAAEYIRNFLEQEPIPGIIREYKLFNQIVPQISMEEVNHAIDRLVHTENTVITVHAPEKPGMILPSENELIALAARADEQTPEPYVDEVAGALLLPVEPEPGTVVERRVLEDLGVVVLKLSNGVEAWLRPTDFKNDEVLFQGAGIGGFCWIPEDEYAAVSAAPAIMSIVGWGGFNSLELQKLLAGKQVSCSPYVGDFSYGVSGGSTPEDLETALQLAYIQLTAPNRDRELFQVFMEQGREALRNRDVVPEAKFSDRVLSLNYGDFYMFRPLTLERFEETDMDKALDAYLDLVSDAASMRFYFVGALDVDAVEPLIARYIGSLPSRGDPRRPLPELDMQFPDGITREKVHAGREPKATTRISWPARVSLDEMEMFRMRMASSILERRLRTLLREEMGGTYSVNVGYNYQPPFRGYATTVVSFGSSPENVDPMIDAVLEEIRKFKELGADTEELEAQQEIERRSVQTRLKDNGYWLGSFVSLYRLGWDPERILHRQSRIELLTLEDLRRDFNLYFPPDNYTAVSLVPEDE